MGAGFFAAGRDVVGGNLNEFVKRTVAMEAVVVCPLCNRRGRLHGDSRCRARRHAFLATDDFYHKRQYE